jgi:hypothetical protein
MKKYEGLFCQCVTLSLVLLMATGSKPIDARHAYSNVLTITGVIPARSYLNSVPSFVPIQLSSKLSSQVVGEVVLNARQIRTNKFSIISNLDQKMPDYSVKMISKQNTQIMPELVNSQENRHQTDLIFPEIQLDSPEVSYDIAVKIKDPLPLKISSPDDTLSSTLTFQVAAL